MKNKIITACFVIGGLLHIVSPAAHASDYKMDKQSSVCSDYLYQWKAGNYSKYLVARNECNRYGMLILQDHNDYDQKEWLTKNVWLVKRGAWLEQRKAAGQYVPREPVTAYFAMLLQEAGIDIFREQDLVGQALHYEKREFSPLDF